MVTRTPSAAPQSGSLAPCRDTSSNVARYESWALLACDTAASANRWCLCLLWLGPDQVEAHTAATRRRRIVWAKDDDTGAWPRTAMASLIALVWYEIEESVDERQAYLVSPRATAREKTDSMCTLRQNKDKNLLYSYARLPMRNTTHLMVFRVVVSGFLEPLNL
jgi:hypothetical protein